MDSDGELASRSSQRPPASSSEDLLHGSSEVQERLYSGLPAMLLEQRHSFR